MIVATVRLVPSTRVVRLVQVIPLSVEPQTSLHAASARPSVVLIVRAATRVSKSGALAPSSAHRPKPLNATKRRAVVDSDPQWNC